MAQHPRSKGGGGRTKAGRVSIQVYSSYSVVLFFFPYVYSKSVGVHGYVLLPGLIVELLEPPPPPPARRSESRAVI
jgi:hypothetical protein